jgi:putative transposase
MQGLASGLARRVNRKLRRRGSLFGDRYHAHSLASPTEVRNAVVYVLKNYEKHAEAIPDRGTEPEDGVDPCSSARWFRGWAQPAEPPELPPPVAEARTWLLSTGWMRMGLVGRRERPSGALGHE